MVEETTLFILNNSPENAKQFIEGINPKLDEIVKNPLIYPKDTNFSSKKGLYRFSIYMKSWKIIFKVMQNLIVFLGIIHTSRHPNEIKKLRTSKYK